MLSTNSLPRQTDHVSHLNVCVVLRSPAKTKNIMLIIILFSQRQGTSCGGRRRRGGAPEVTSGDGYVDPVMERRMLCFLAEGMRSSQLPYTPTARRDLVASYSGIAFSVGQLSLRLDRQWEFWFSTYAVPRRQWHDGSIAPGDVEV